MSPEATAVLLAALEMSPEAAAVVLAIADMSPLAVAAFVPVFLMSPDALAVFVVVCAISPEAVAVCEAVVDPALGASSAMMLSLRRLPDALLFDALMAVTVSPVSVFCDAC